MTASTRNAWFTAVALAVATTLSLPGCGPGVGGTGTGGAALSAFGATATSVCGSAIALELGCAQAPAPAPSSAGGQTAGTSPVQLVDVGGRVTLDLAGNTATLASSCLKLRFDGDFGHAASGDAFFGTVQLQASNAETLGALTAAPATGGGLIVELRDAGGTTLLGPIVLQHATVPLAAPKAC